MPVTINDIRTNISTEIRRGTTFDSEIDTYLRRAARQLERNFDWDYMDRQTATIAFTSGTATYSVSAFCTGELKKIKFLRIPPTATNSSATGGSYRYIRKIKMEEAAEQVIDTPTGFSLLTKTSIKLLETPDTTYSGVECLYSMYTVWPTGATSSPWLVDNAEEVLVSQTILMMANRIKLSTEEIQRVKFIRDEGLKTLGIAEQELQQSAEDQQMLPYDPDTV